MSAHTRSSHIPLLQTSVESPGAGQVTRNRDWKFVLTTGVLVSAFFGLLILICVTPSPLPSKSVQRSNVTLKSSQNYVSHKEVEKPTTPQHKGTLIAMRKDVVNLAPRIYGSVGLVLEDGSYFDGKGRAHKDLNAVGVKCIEIFIRSQSWDRLQSQKKIDLLYQTFMLFKSRYPFINRVARLVFDDGRQNLELKFDGLYAEMYVESGA